MLSTLFLLSFTAYVAGFPSNPYPVHPGVGGIYKGPNSETIIKGPDGSVITAEAEGAEVAIEEKPEEILIEDRKEVIVQPVVPILETQNIVAEAKAEVVAQPILVQQNVETPVGADLVGPSGVVSTLGGHSIVSGPASTSIDGHEVLAPIEEVANDEIVVQAHGDINTVPIVPNSPIQVEVPEVHEVVLPRIEEVPVLKGLHRGVVLDNYDQFVARKPLIGAGPPSLIKTGPIVFPNVAPVAVPKVYPIHYGRKYVL